MIRYGASAFLDTNNKTMVIKNVLSATVGNDNTRLSMSSIELSIDRAELLVVALVTSRCIFGGLPNKTSIGKSMSNEFKEAA